LEAEMVAAEGKTFDAKQILTILVFRSQHTVLGE
jgi:hypothetical protein